MLTAYERKLLTSYLANIASGLKRRDPEARELIDWIADRDNRIALGARTRRRRRRLRSDLEKEKISTKKLRCVEESLRKECSDIPARRDRTALRLRRLGKTAGLNRTDTDILELLLRYETHAVFESMIDDIFESPGPSMNVLNPRGWAASLILGLTTNTIQSRLQDGAPLVRSGLVSMDNDGDLEIPPRFRRLATAPGDGSIDVTRLLLDVAPPAELEWTDFGHVAADRDHVEKLLRGALDNGKPGVNVLLYGPPGTGKTEFCKALAARLGVTLYSVGEADDDGDEPSRKQRLQELRLAQRLIANKSGSLLLFDEMEDLLEDSFGGFGMFGPLRSSRSREATSKVFMHRLLEQTPAPTLWTMNDADEVSPAILRLSTAAGICTGAAAQKWNGAGSGRRRQPSPACPRPPPPPRRSRPGHGPAGDAAAQKPRASTAAEPGHSPSRCRPCENSGGDGDGGLGHHDLRRSHVIWRFGVGSPAEGAPGLGGSMWGARFWLDSRLMPSRRRSRREHLPARSRGGCCKPAP